MALYLLYADTEHRNAVGMRSVLVDAASESTARDLAHSSAPWGAVDVRNWNATTVAATAALPGGRTSIWFEGMCASMHGKTRGGDSI